MLPASSVAGQPGPTTITPTSTAHQARLNQLNQLAARPDRHRDALVDAVLEAEHGIGLHDRLKRFDGHTNTCDSVRQVIDALDIWRDWAYGHDRVNHAIDTLNGIQDRRSAVAWCPLYPTTS